MIDPLEYDIAKVKVVTQPEKETLDASTSDFFMRNNFIPVEEPVWDFDVERTERALTESHKISYVNEVEKGKADFLPNDLMTDPVRKSGYEMPEEAPQLERTHHNFSSLLQDYLQSSEKLAVNDNLSLGFSIERENPRQPCFQTGVPKFSVPNEITYKFE